MVIMSAEIARSTFHRCSIGKWPRYEPFIRPAGSRRRGATVRCHCSQSPAEGRSRSAALRTCVRRSASLALESSGTLPVVRRSGDGNAFRQQFGEVWSHPFSDGGFGQLRKPDWRSVGCHVRNRSVSDMWNSSVAATRQKEREGEGAIPDTTCFSQASSTWRFCATRPAI